MGFLPWYQCGCWWVVDKAWGHRPYMLKDLGRFLTQSVYIALVIILVYEYMKDVEYALVCKCAEKCYGQWNCWIWRSEYFFLSYLRWTNIGFGRFVRPKIGLCIGTIRVGKKKNGGGYPLYFQSCEHYGNTHPSWRKNYKPQCALWLHYKICQCLSKFEECSF